ncbi:retinoid-inducible serine carboxypeptidase isoform X2 [Fopius arisanus]|uniref:Retinoid-inducible serine carboxypeptidase n=1 Tax=Fopius arisanus TaxID=64838 RepID=A0A9R1SYH0_9HYME|nr:PREDICTED: retinoid-inducible serine carboxypeptidase-like isoform X2 [Fopius arisanus]
MELSSVQQGAGKKGFGPGEQEWGYVTVRPGAHMFWWLYYVTPESYKLDVNGNASVYDKPLIIWLQGGPGSSSTAIGNFEEIGPIDVEGNLRNVTWVRDCNVLFVDNPVGAGFSYVDDINLFAKNNLEIATDLVECMMGFLTEFPGFKDVDIYIFSQSYGGKMASEFALEWYKAQKAGNIQSNLKGVGLGNSWISPIDSMRSWAPFLFSVGAVDTRGKEAIEILVRDTERATNEGSWKRAMNLYWDTANLVSNLTSSMDFYNILEKVRVDGSSEEPTPLDRLMQTQVSAALHVNVTWGNQSDHVLNHLENDFMRNVTHIVKKLIDDTDLKIFVFSGQLDFIVATLGTVSWVEKLQENDDEWKNSPRKPLIVNNVVEGYQKKSKNFEMYWINRAGHSVPADNPIAAREMLIHMIKGPSLVPVNGD